MFYVTSKIYWMVAAPTNFLILVTAIACVWAALRRSKVAASIAAVGACMLIVGAFTPVGLWLMQPLENRFPQRSPSALSAPDGIIILGGDSGERIVTLAELSRRFPQARLIYSGPGERIFANEELLDTFARLGGDPARITLELKSRNTFENAIYSRALINPNPNERWLLVTSAAHMPRAVGCFRRAGFRIAPYPIGYKTGARTRPLLEFGSGSQALIQLDAAVREWTGLIVYRLMGKTDALFPAP